MLNACDMLSEQVLQEKIKKIVIEVIEESVGREFSKRVKDKEALEIVNKGIDEVVEKAVKKGSDIYHRVLERGGGEKPSEEEGEKISMEIFKEALVQEMVRKWESEMSKEKFPIANPGMVEKARKEELLNQLKKIGNLSGNNWSIENFETSEKVYSELDRLDLLGNFKRTDFRFPLAQISRNISMFDRALQPACLDLAEKLCALPFELNAKIRNLNLSISSDFLVCALRPGEKIDTHRDNGASENGRTISALVFLGSGGVLEISDQQMPVPHGSLVLMKSRKVSWSAKNSGKDKIFVFFFFIYGPKIEEW